MTPEELAILQQIMMNGKTLSDFKDPQPAQPSVAAPYQAQAKQYTTQADTLEKQAAEPYPHPTTAKEHIVSALRAGMENFGRLGAPGGYSGQEAQRQKDFTDANDKRLAQVTALRGEAARQEQLGQQKEFQTSEIADRNRNTDINQKEYDLKKELAARPGRVNETTGSSSVGVDLATQKPLPGTEVTGPARPDTYKNYPYRDAVNTNGHTIRTYFDHSPDNIIANEDLGIKTATSGGGFSPTTFTDPVTGLPTAGGYDKKENTITPAHLTGDPTKAPVQTVAAGNNQVAVHGKEKAAYDDANNSYNALVGLRDQSAKDPNTAYINDQGMVDQFFNIVKPTSGARMNGAYISQLLHPGPVADRIWALVQKLGNGAPLTQPDREYMVQAAKIVLDAKGKGLQQAAPGGAAPAGSNFISPGGPIDTLLKSKQVAPQVVK